jgi:hypothetical protein
MAALHGKEDPLLEPSRFPRFLRQVHDAEIADVRQVGEGEYEITRRVGPVLGEFVPAPLAASSVPAGAPGLAGEDGSAAPAPASPPRAAALRFRRGSRALTRPPEVPLVGVVQFETPAAGSGEAAEEKPKRRAPSRRRASSRPKKEA